MAKKRTEQDLEVEAQLHGLTDFVDYCTDFYGPGGIYPNFAADFTI